MLKKRKNKETNLAVVTTKEQLKKAVEQKKEHIEIRGDLAKKLRWMGKLSPSKIIALSAALGGIAVGSAAAPIATVSFVAVEKIAGKELARIIIASGLTVTMLISILKGYDIEAEYNGDSILLKCKRPRC